jgi:lipopolysaccharide/colanic/teichoic acid biosynthesis glycosyltransferase
MMSASTETALLRHDEDSPKLLTMSLADEPIGVGLTLVAANPSCEVQPSEMSRRMKRMIDIVGAVLGLMVCLVPAVIIALIVKVTSGGPVLFRQRRVGLGGVEFEVIKFRTMRHGTHDEVLADQAAHEVYVDNDFKLSPDDPRITPVGRVLRKSSLDEVPQLLNVLVGEMSIVGVRPLLDEELALRPEYDQALYRRRRPGMTGLWQVEGRSTVQKTDRLHLDRCYLEDRSLTQDLKILARTPFAVLRLSRAH